MKTFSIIAKIVVALAAVAGIVYVVATYGDKIVAWAKGLLGRCKNKCCCDDECECECDCCEEAEETEEIAEEAEAEEVVAAEADFAE